ncbi:MAG: zf-HC2 domain-containing protein [bacterium]|jgi:hypothetical protein
MKCSKVIEILGSYCRGELADGEADVVRQHLTSCPQCAEEHRLTARVMGALGEVERIEPRADFALRLSEKIDAWEAGKRMFWLGALAGFIRSNRRVLATAAAVFVFSLIGSIFLIQQMGPGSDMRMEERMAAPGEVLDGIPVQTFAMTEVPQPAATDSDSVYMHYVTGDRPAYPGEEFEDYAYRPVVRTVSVPGRTY